MAGAFATGPQGIHEITPTGPAGAGPVSIMPTQDQIVDVSRFCPQSYSKCGWVAKLVNDAQAAVTAWLTPVGACILAMSLTMEVQMEIHAASSVTLLAVAWVPSG